MGLEKSIAEMIERQESLSDLADAANQRLTTYIGRASPGLQSSFAITKNQAGKDARGLGRPDAWGMPSNNGVSSWSLEFRISDSISTLDPSGPEFEFVSSLPKVSRTGGGFNYPMHVWRFSWDFNKAVPPEHIVPVDSSGHGPFIGTIGFWYKDPDGIVDAAMKTPDTWSARTNGWGTWHSATLRSRPAGPGEYYHPRPYLRSADMPTTGHMLIAGHAAITGFCRSMMWVGACSPAYRAPSTALTYFTKSPARA